MKNEENRMEQGVIALDASVSLTLFIFFVLLIYSLFLVFQAQHRIAYALIESGQSLSLDSYYGERLMETKSLTDDVASLMSGFFGLSSNDPYYVADSKWYKNGNVEQEAKKRFIAYFANGSDAKADEMLKLLKVKNGLSGLNFSESRVSNGKLYLTVKYKLKYQFNAFGWGELNLKQTACSKMWGLKK